MRGVSINTILDFLLDPLDKGFKLDGHVLPFCVEGPARPTLSDGTTVEDTVQRESLYRDTQIETLSRKRVKRSNAL